MKPTNERLALVLELERLTREREGMIMGESPLVRAQRQTRIDELVVRIKNNPSPTIGTAIAGSQLVRIIGKGNFGVVWQATDLTTGDPRAVKIFDFDRLGLALTLYHFRRGVRAMRHLRDADGRPPSVVRLYDSEETDLAFSMAYMEAGDLTNISSRGWSLEKKLGVFESICEGVKFAHEQKIVHRDIKPANVVMTKDQQPVLTDFDISDLLFIKTLSTAACGTVFYAAPEQLAGKARKDATADIFSLGRLLHFLLIEKDPEFYFDEVPQLRDLKEFPLGLVRIIRKCTTRDPDKRYSSVSDLVRDLRVFEQTPNSVGISVIFSGKAEKDVEKYRILLESGLGNLFDLLNLRPSPDAILKHRTLFEFLGGEVVVLKDDRRAIVHGGPPYKIGKDSYEESERKYITLRNRLLSLEKERELDSAKPADESELKIGDSIRNNSEGEQRDGLLESPTPVAFLREAIRAVPAVKWAMGIGGILAVIAIVREFGISLKVAVVGCVIMIVLMTLLVIFAYMSRSNADWLRKPAVTLTWFTLIALMAVTTALFTSVFFHWPLDLQKWLQ